MSAKWVRSQQWDDRHLTGALWPAKVVLRLFSWVSTSIVLLAFVALYGVLASVPIGLLARIPTVLFIALIFAILFACGAALPTWITAGMLRRKGVSRVPRFLMAAAMFLVLCAGATVIWVWGLWPLLRYDPVAGTGVRFFGAFIDKYQTVQFRRLPMMEMNELEFYAWWPLRVVLLLFVLNLVVATVRRIEFSFPRIGVLTVHTGIVTIALGSVYYTSHKQEGDMILLSSGGTDATGKPLPARAENGFYDNTRTALWVTQDRMRGWDQRLLRGMPRYNDYNLNVVPRSEPAAPPTDAFGPLDISVPGRAAREAVHLIDDDITFRIVGYASYAELSEEWLPSSAVKGAGAPVLAPERVRMLDLALTANMPDGQQAPRKSWRLFPDHPALRFEQNALGVEYTIGMPEVRWNALATKLPPGSGHVLLVEHPQSGFKAVYSVSEKQIVTVGETGYTLSVTSLAPRPPMPLVTRGYEGASSSLAIVRVQPSVGSGGGKPAAFDRWIYSRFPEISQDMLDELNERGMPKRRDADPGIRIIYIDATTLNVYFDERADGTVRALVRQVGADAVITEYLKPGAQVQIAPVAAIKLGSRLDDAVRVEVPEIVPDEARDRQRIGNHEASAAAVEVRTKQGLAGVYWVPFSKYLTIGREEGGMARDVRLPDGRQVTIAFGRQRHEFWPRMTVRLHDFEMIPYEHSETPKDYRSDVEVTTEWPGPRGEIEPKSAIHRTSLNNPLLIVTPYVAPEGMPLIGRVLGRMMSVIAPNQYKFAQAGWDQSGWRESQQMVAEGRLPKPIARFTILGVGNNPGIYIIAAGAIMMSIGIPWAFYLKPWLLQRQKRKIQEQLARTGGRLPNAAKLNGTAETHEKKRTTEGAKP